MTAEQIYYFVTGAVLALTLVILWVAVIMPDKNQWNKRFFVSLFAVFVLSMMTLFIDLVIYEDPTMALEEKITIYRRKSSDYWTA